MDKQAIIHYIQENGGTEIAALQKQFSLSYRETKALVDSLVGTGFLKFVGGLRFVCTKKPEPPKEKTPEMPADDREQAKRATQTEESKKALLDELHDLWNKNAPTIKTGKEVPDDEKSESHFFSVKKNIQSMQLGAIRRVLSNTATLRAEKGRTVIRMPSLYLYARSVQFALLEEGDTIYLTDDGMTSRILGGKLVLDERCRDIIEQHELTEKDGELRVKVTSPDYAVACLLRIYAAMAVIARVSGMAPITKAENEENEKESKPKEDEKKESKPKENEKKAGKQGEEALIADKGPEHLFFTMGNCAAGLVKEDLENLQHLLVAGLPGTGGTVLLEEMILDFVRNHSPQSLRILLIDSRHMLGTRFEGLPHLLTGQMIAGTQPTLNALDWAIKETDRRYKLFEAARTEGQKVRTFDEYNRACAESEKLPRLVVILTELAAVPPIARRKFGARLQSLAQRARPAGVHLVAGSESPTVDAIPQELQELFPAVVGFRVGSVFDSMSLLGERGAEALPAGRMLFRNKRTEYILRLQSVYTASDALKKLLTAVKTGYAPAVDREAVDFIHGGKPIDEDAFYPPDDLCIKVLRFVVREQKTTPAQIQRAFSISFARTSKIMDWMERMKFIAPLDGPTPRAVLLTVEAFDELYGAWE